jgi:hypothetical protein
VIVYLQLLYNGQTACCRARLRGKLCHGLHRILGRDCIAAGSSKRHAVILCGHKTNHILHSYHVVAEQALQQVMLIIGVLNFVSVNHGEGALSLQPPANTTWKRIGAGVPPGLQIQ